MHSLFKFDVDLNLPIIELVQSLILSAHEILASDIHIDPQEKDTIVRFRIDGLLYIVCTLEKSLHSELVARLKVVAGLRTDEKLLPQDGRYTFNENLDIRLTTVASYYGESVVMRLLKRDVVYKSLKMLGFAESEQLLIEKTIKYPQGLILVTGPTGSGKTTTLYTLLSMLNESTRSIVTIEDPIEYAIKGIRQLQVQNKKGIHFSTGLRSILRQDPDVIMVGEIRDSETALLSIQAALTGHLVISTIHTNSAVSTIARLIDMGIEPYLLSATLRLVINQRLIRTVCANCVENKLITDTVLQFAFNYGHYITQKEIPIAVGCESCGGTGYKGRSVIEEVLVPSEEFKEALMKRTSIAQLEKMAIEAGMRPIIRSGFNKCANHETTFEELARISY